jgi:hypothetical protein
VSNGSRAAELTCSLPQDAARRGEPRLDGSMGTLMIASKQDKNQLGQGLIVSPRVELRYTEFHQYVQPTLNADLRRLSVSE